MILGRTIPRQLEAGEQEISPNIVKYKTKPYFSFWRAWDYDPQVGLVMAGSQSPKSRIVEMSQNGGNNFTSLPIIPYGRNQYGACLVIVDDETVFYAGGYTSKKYENSYEKKIPLHCAFFPCR